MGYYEKHFPLVVQSKKSGDLWLMRRPYRQSANPKYMVLFIWGKNDRYRVVQKISSKQFIERFRFIGRLK